MKASTINCGHYQFLLECVISLIDAELLGILPCNRFPLMDMTGKLLLIMQIILPPKSVAT